MTNAAWPDHLLTTAEWDALPEDTSRRYELVEGVLVLTPRPLTFHQRAVQRLAYLLDERLPEELTALHDVEVVIDPVDPPTFRAPDVVVTRSAYVEENPSRLVAGAVVLAVEIVSPGSRRTDRVAKLAEYAEAGIAHYWILDLEPPASIEIYRLIGERYELSQSAAGKAEITVPCAFTLDLDGLTSRRPR